MVERLAIHIAEQEGFWIVNSRASRNHNPGNIMYVGQSKAIGNDDKGFAVFALDIDGWENLWWQLNYILSGKSKCYKPENTIKEFIGIWASTSPENEKAAYANAIAKEFGTNIDTKLNELFI